MNIQEITITNYKSINSAIIHDCKRINIFVGRNGAGKTNLLNAIKSYEYFGTSPGRNLPNDITEDDLWVSKQDYFTVSHKLLFGGANILNFIKQLREKNNTIPKDISITACTAIVNIKTKGHTKAFQQEYIDKLKADTRYNRIGDFISREFQIYISNKVNIHVLKPDDIAANSFMKLSYDPNNILMQNFGNFVTCLHNLQLNKEKGDQILDNIVRRIQTVLPEVTGILVQVEKTSLAGGEYPLAVYIRFSDNRVIRFDKTSDGIRRVVLLATFFETNTQEGVKHEIVILDSPETYLHPGAQRQLMDLLINPDFSGDRQFFIATHSPVLLEFIDNDSVGIYNVTRTPKEGTKVEKLDSDRLAEAYSQIGHRYGSAIQADAVIWVEGPVDMVVIRKCLYKYPDFNGKNIEVMHLGGDNIKSKDFDHKTLKTINPNSFVIIDSELKSPTDNCGKRDNFINACESDDIKPSRRLERRSIENYLVDAIPDDLKKGYETGPYDDPEPLKSLINRRDVGGLSEVADNWLENCLEGTDIDEFLKAIEAKLNEQE